MENEQLLHQILAVIDEFQGQDRIVLRVDKVCDFADYFVIVSGTSTKHVQSLTEELALRCKHAGSQAFNVEGLEAGEWCLLDFGAVVVHVFVPDKRAHYNLEQGHYTVFVMTRDTTIKYSGADAEIPIKLSVDIAGKKDTKDLGTINICK